MKLPLHLIIFLLLPFAIYSQEQSRKELSYFQFRNSGKANLLKSKEASYSQLEKTYKLATDQNDKAKQLETLLASNRIANRFLDLQKYKYNLEEIDAIFDYLQPKELATTTHKTFSNQIYANKGRYYFLLSDFETSRTYYDRLNKELNRKKLLTLDDIDLQIEAYIMEGDMYSKENKLDSAKIQYEKTIKLLRTYYPNNLKMLHQTHIALAEILKEEGDYLNSNMYYLKALNYFSQRKKPNNTYLTSMHGIAKNFLLLEEIDSANFYLQLMNDQLGEKNPLRRQYYQTKAQLYLQAKETTKAFSVLDSAVKFTTSLKKNTYNLDLVKSILAFADIQTQQNQYQAALENYHKAEEVLKGETTVNNILLLHIYKQRALINNLQGSKINYLNTESIVIKGIRVLDSILPYLNKEQAMGIIPEDSHSLFENGLEALYALYSKIPDNNLVEQAFYISEKSKNTQWHQAMINGKASRFGSIPQEWIESEKQLRAEIYYLEEKLASSKQTSRTLETLNKRRKQFQSFLEKTQKTYPSYYNLKYNTEVASIEEVQNYINNQQQVISYFMGKKAIYIVSFGKIKIQFIKVPISNKCSKKIDSLYQLTRIPSTNMKAWKEVSNAVYDDILSPALRLHQNRLIIIPDGILHYIPFGSLYTDSEETDFLIERASVSYAPSASVFIQLQDNQYKKQNLLGFAPTYNRNLSNDLLQLPHNKPETIQIQKYFKGDVFEDFEANIANFKANVPNYGLLHLATHTTFNDYYPEASFIAFSEGRQQDRLFVKDIYNLNIQANMVTLSASRNKVDTLQTGGGMQTMARGFYYAGALSLAYSFWNTNDASSVSLMDRFYAYLEEGFEKDLALQKAKNEFLYKNRGSALVHPYYWSGYTLHGNINAIKTSTSIWKYLAPILLMVIGVLFIRYFRT